MRFLNCADCMYFAGKTNILATAIETSQSCGEQGESQKAVDGEQYNDCKCAKIPKQANPWWSGLLPKLYSISEVILSTRHKCCGE